MRGQHRPRRPPNGRVGGQRLGREDIERRAGDRSLLERGGERIEIDDLAAGGIHDDGGRLQLREGRSVDESAGLLRKRDVERDDVGRPQELVELDEPSSGRARRRLGREGVVGDHGHAESDRAARHLAADPAHADEAERLPAELAADELRPGPLAGAHAAVRVDDTAEQGERQRHGVLGRGDDVAKRRVHHVDAARGRGRDVDVVHPDAGPAHHLEGLGRVEDRGGHLRLAAHDEGVDVAEARRELGLLQARGLAHLAARTEQRETLFRERVRDVDDAAAASDGSRRDRPRAARPRAPPGGWTAAACSPRRCGARR